MEFTLPATTAAASRARESVRGILTGWGLDGEADTATLLVSELVTNAVRHAGTTLGISLTKSRDNLLVSVSDGAGTEWPRLVEAGEDDEGGRGLWLVDRLARSWGTNTGLAGKSVWFELALDPPAR